MNYDTKGFESIKAAGVACKHSKRGHIRYYSAY